MINVGPGSISTGAGNSDWKIVQGFIQSLGAVLLKNGYLPPIL